MIAPPDGWSARRVDETITLVAPAGERAGAITYRERLRPLAGLIDLIKLEPPPPGFVPHAADAIQDLITREGEYGALWVVDGQLRGEPAVFGLGFVLLDDFYSCARGVASSGHLPNFRAVMRELVVGDAHILGRVRRRRYRYTAPAGWSEQRRLFESRFAPGDADDPRAIVVGPALPKVPGLVDAILAGVLGGADPALALRGVPVTTASGLGGKRWLLRASGLESDVVILEDDSFLYCARLDAKPGGPARLDALGPLVDSIQPIPKPATTTPSTPFANWAE